MQPLAAATVLLVDDYDIIRYAQSEYLRRQGFTVVEAASGDEALRLVRDQPDIVLLDVNLPDLSGLEVCRRIKADPATAGIPVLHLTATAIDVPDQVAGLRGGADGYLPASVDGEILTATIRSFVRTRRAEMAVRQARGFSEALIDTVGSLVVVLDRNGCIVRFNRACEKTTDYTSAEVLGRPIWEILSPVDEAEALGAVVNRLLASQVLDQFESHWVTRAGRRRLIAWSTTVMRDSAGEVAYVIGTGRDVTEQRMSEVALRESEERFRVTFEQAAVGIVHLLPDGRWLRANQKLCDILGYTHDEMFATSISTVTHPDDLPADLAQIQRLLAGEIDSYTLEKRFRRKDGSFIWSQVTRSLVRGSSGEPAYFVGVIEDISDRVRAKSGLRARERQQEAVARLGIKAVSGGDIQILLDEAVARVAETLDVEFAKVLELLPAGRSLIVRAGVGWQKGIIGQATLDTTGGSQASYTLRNTAPVIVENLRADTRFHGPSFLHEHGIVSGLSVVIGGREQPFGVLGAHTRARRTFTQDDVNFLQSVASVLASAIERGRAEADRADVLAREQAATARAEAEARYRALLESAPDAIVSVDRDGRIAVANSRSEEMFGYRHDELIGQFVELLLPERYREWHVGHRASYVANPRIGLMGADRDLFGRRRDGSEFPVEVSLSPLETVDGLLVTSIIRDVAERKRAGEALRRSEESLARAQRIAQLGNWDWDVLTGEVRWSDEIYRIFDISPDQSTVTHETLLMTVHPEDRHRVQQAIRDALDDKAPYDIDHRVVRRDLTERIVHQEGEVLRDHDGRPLRVIGTVHDVTAERRANAEREALLARVNTARADAEAAQRRFAFLADASRFLSTSLDFDTLVQQSVRLPIPTFADACGILLVDENGTLRPVAMAHVDREVEDKLLLLKPEISIESRHPHPIADVVRTGQAILLSTVTPEMMEKLATDPERRDLFREMASTSAMIIPLVTRQRTIGVLTFCWTRPGWRYWPQDMALAEELARRVVLALENASLFQQSQASQEEAVRQTARMTEFYHLIAHDVRQPITIARSYATILSRAVERGSLERVISSAKGIDLATRRLESMIQELVDSAQLDAGQMRLTLESIELRGFVFDLLARLIGTLEVERVRVEASAPVVVHADANRLERILGNLISNALKYGQPETEVTVGVYAEANGALLTIADQGPGVQPDDLPHLFERGFRTRLAVQSREGLGLGLFITRLLVEAHGGRIWAESEPGKGSTFYVELPLAAARSETNPAASGGTTKDD
jgi:PAS domain S-box-containing protein